MLGALFLLFGGNDSGYGRELPPAFLNSITKKQKKKHAR